MVAGLPELSTSTVPARKPPPPGVRRVFEELASGAVNGHRSARRGIFFQWDSGRYVLEVDVPAFFVNRDRGHADFHPNGARKVDVKLMSGDVPRRGLAAPHAEQARTAKTKRSRMSPPDRAACHMVSRRSCWLLWTSSNPLPAGDDACAAAVLALCAPHAALRATCQSAASVLARHQSRWPSSWPAAEAVAVLEKALASRPRGSG